MLICCLKGGINTWEIDFHGSHFTNQDGDYLYFLVDVDGWLAVVNRHYHKKSYIGARCNAILK